MNKILKLYDQKFILKLFQEKVLPQYPEFLKIDQIEIQRHKNHIWETTYHVVVEYKTYFLDKSGRQNLKLIFCVAHSEEPRKNAFSALNYLWQNGFAGKSLTIPKPLFYDDEFEGVFYEGVEGINLYQFIRVKDKEKIEEIVPQAARIFAKMHSLPADKFPNFNEENSLIRRVIPGRDHILKTVKKHYQEYFEIYKKAYDYFISAEENFLSGGQRWLVHGDAHPENIIRMGSSKIALIDFSDICLSDFARDLGCFTQQVEFMVMRKICDEDYACKISTLFLDNYVASAKIKIDEDLKRRIDIYYHWTEIRTATHFLMKDKPEPERSIALLEKLESYLKNIQ